MTSRPVPLRPESPLRTLGTLNIVFGSLTLMWSLCSDGALVAMPPIMKMMSRQVASVQATLDAQNEGRVDQLRQQMAEVKTEAERDAIRKQIARQRAGRMVVATTVQAQILDTMDVQDPRFFAHYGATILSALVLDTALIVAGTGLMRLRRWGRTLSLWVAGLTIVRLLAVAASTALVARPVWERINESMFASTAMVGLDEASIREMAAMGRTFNYVWLAAIVVLGLAYPIVSLWLLNTRASLAALGLAKPGPAADEWPELAPGPALPPELAGVIPDPRGPRRIGVLALIFGLVLVVGMNVMQLIFTAFLPTYSRVMHAIEAAQTRGFQEDRRRNLEAARARVTDAKTEAERAEAREEVRALETNPVQPAQPQAFVYDAMNDRRVKPMLWADAITGLALNVAMFAGGIGLIQLREWGRRTVFWVAALKVARIAAALVLGVGVAAPVLGQAMGTSLASYMAQMPGARGPGPQQMRSIMTILWTAGLVVYELLALIWPVIVLWVLSRPRARAACLLAERGRS